MDIIKIILRHTNTDSLTKAKNSRNILTLTVSVCSFMWQKIFPKLPLVIICINLLILQKSTSIFTLRQINLECYLYKIIGKTNKTGTEI